MSTRVERFDNAFRQISDCRSEYRNGQTIVLTAALGLAANVHASVTYAENVDNGTKILSYFLSMQERDSHSTFIQREARAELSRDRQANVSVVYRNEVTSSRTLGHFRLYNPAEIPEQSKYLAIESALVFVEQALAAVCASGEA